MKKTIPTFIMMTMMVTLTGKAQEMTNDFYDDAETYALAGNTVIEIAGEIENPGKVDITAFEMRSLIIKEAVMSGDTNRFVGAYRYDGYSLYDILNRIVLKKKNEPEFPPIIDMYVTLENSEGDKVVLSWGELYYPVHRHEIIIAIRVARIVPSKTKDLWPLPVETKLIVAQDLITERNISNPTKITVHSVSRSYPVNRELQPLYSPMITVYNGENREAEITKMDANELKLTYETVFYGRGRGIHSTTPFHGMILKDMLGKYFSMTPEKIRQAYFVIASVDGYRCVFSFSEVFNRNDQAETLLVEDPGNNDGGAFRLFPAGDFFSDRAVKAVSEIRLVE